MELSNENTSSAAIPWRDTERRHSASYDASTLHSARRYEIISELGGGAMSAVRLAHDTATGRIVAIKSVAPEAVTLPGAQRRFAREAAIVTRLQHPNLLRTVAVEREETMPIAIVTEYVRGRSLRDVLGDHGPLPIERAVRILRDVAAALAFAHAQGIVHCDVKPANILLDDEHDRAVLIDFGIACGTGARPDVDDEALTVGTPAYMAPEQIEGRAVDARTDVYALCIVAWELLAGRMPWLGDPLADVLHRQRYEALPDLALVRPDVPVYLLDAINGGLAKDPARRWRDGGELLRHLSPRALSVASAASVRPTLDATMYVDVPTVYASELHAEPEPYGSTVPRRTRALASTLAAVALLALGSLAPSLSHATDRRPVAVDPELDSMLTLAVSAGSDRAPMTGATGACSASSRSGRTTHCPPTPHRGASSHAGRSAHRAASHRRGYSR